MPIREYKCKKCNLEFERIETVSTVVLPKCPKCKGSTERLISVPSQPQFKGTGFYETTYKKRT